MKTVSKLESRLDPFVFSISDIKQLLDSVGKEFDTEYEITSKLTVKYKKSQYSFSLPEENIDQLANSINLPELITIQSVFLSGTVKGNDAKIEIECGDREFGFGRHHIKITSGSENWNNGILKIVKDGVRQNRQWYFVLYKKYVFIPLCTLTIALLVMNDLKSTNFDEIEGPIGDAVMLVTIFYAAIFLVLFMLSVLWFIRKVFPTGVIARKQDYKKPTFGQVILTLVPVGNLLVQIGRVFF